MPFIQEWPAYLEALIRLLYPATCGLCSEMLNLQQRGLCKHCRNDLVALQYPISKIKNELSLTGIENVWTLFPYESTVRDLITAVKFSGKHWLLKEFSQSLQTFGMLASDAPSYDFVASIPSHVTTYVQREFNQADLLAQMVSKITRTPVKNMLHKKFHTPHQSRLNRRERAVNLWGVFSLRPKYRSVILDKSVLIVDDILTTGSTAEEAARCLADAGAAKIDFLALARTEPAAL
ncbi:MAG: hypothetical protein A2Z83_07425 [Omnitrophica bacterium GWA2_52_8]|nr:MAG: hypothetical protein A2Z83_07425 [Omnitrophica bacterium GWA2_52_8]